MLFPSSHFVLVPVVLYLSTSPSAPNPPPPPRVESRGSRLGRGVSRRPTLSARSTQLCCCRCSSSSSTSTRLCRTDGAVQLHLADPHDSTTVHRPHSLTLHSTPLLRRENVSHQLRHHPSQPPHTISDAMHIFDTLL